MIRVKRNVIYGAHDWYGLDVHIDQTHLRIKKGRIGNTTNPLQCDFEGKKITGGWFVPSTQVPLSPEIERIDILHKENKAYVMLRSSDDRETYSDDYVLLLSLAWKEDGIWHITVPDRGEEYEKDAR